MIVDWENFLLPYRQAVDEITLKLLNIKNEMILKYQYSPVENVYGRVKSVTSILDKANKKNVPFTDIASKIEDIAGVRIICRFVEDIEKIVDMIRIRKDFDISVLEEKDYVANRKESGYRSYHVLIKYKIFVNGEAQQISAEIQVRTLAMDFWATIEHSLNYKYNGKIPTDIKLRLSESAEAAFVLDTEMSKIRDEINQAQKIILIKNDLVDDILLLIQKLYFEAQMEKANELNRKFIELYEEDNLEKMFAFKKQLQTIAELYNV